MTEAIIANDKITVTLLLKLARCIKNMNRTNNCLNSEHGPETGAITRQPPTSVHTGEITAKAHQTCPSATISGDVIHAAMPPALFVCLLGV